MLQWNNGHFNEVILFTFLDLSIIRKNKSFWKNDILKLVSFFISLVKCLGESVTPVSGTHPWSWNGTGSSISNPSPWELPWFGLYLLESPPSSVPSPGRVKKAGQVVDHSHRLLRSPLRKGICGLWVLHGFSLSLSFRRHAFRVTPGTVH